MTTKLTVRQRNHRKRLFGWIFFYLLVLAIVVAIVYLQGSKVNTLELPNGQLQLTVSKSKYTVGDTVQFTIRNNFSSPIYLLNKCPQELLHVYQFKNSAWERIHDTATSSSCSSAQQKITIPPGTSTTKTYADWPNLFSKPGIYRLVAFADNYPNLAYADFQVVQSSKPIPLPAPLIIYKPVYTPIYIPVTGGGGGDN
ncbi:MAG TPA: hypothetical protein VNE40_03780 [Candidatus Dormibacteraeota bacterium]|nr:hypothetical protein [Candidatus Dormibacteraeota bacterium]